MKTPNRKIRIAIAEDHEIVRHGLKTLINLKEELRVIFDVGNGAELIDKLKGNIKPDVILLDIEMPAVDGREALRLISHKYPSIKVLMLSMHTKFDYIHECIALGAHGFLTKSTDFEKMIDAIYSVVYKGFYFDDKVSKALLMNARRTEVPPVTPDSKPLDTVDLEVINLICRGFSTAEIADKLFKSSRTIDGRRNRIAIKTGTKSPVELVVYAIKHQIFKIE